MLKIGITGGIGSGKTTVCKVFELLDIPVYYADEEAKKILETDASLKDQILQQFGANLLNSDHTIDRKKLAALVFNNKKKLEQLNAIVHPAVDKHFHNWLKLHSSSKYILKEAAILFESGAYRAVDKVIAVVAPVELKITRVMNRDKSTPQQIEQRMNNQLSDDEIIKRSQYIIHNDEQQLVLPQILKIHNELLSRKELSIK